MPAVDDAGGVLPAPVAESLDAGESPLTRIRRVLPDLNGALRACAEYVLAHAWELRGQSIQMVAGHIGVSTHAVNRFTRRIGYRGYRDFSHALATELGRIQGAAYALPEPLLQALKVSPGDAAGPRDVVSRVFALELSALRDTWRSLDMATVERAVAVLAAAERILFTATGAAIGVGQTAAFRFTVLGFSAAMAADPATQTAQIHLLRPGDVLVALSFHGTSATVVEGLELARSRGIPTIAITAVPDSPVSRLADLPLVVFGEDEALAFGQFASRVATATLLDALASAVAWVRRETSLPHAREVTRTNQRLHTVLSVASPADARAAREAASPAGRADVTRRRP